MIASIIGGAVGMIGSVVANSNAASALTHAYERQKELNAEQKTLNQNNLDITKSDYAAITSGQLHQASKTFQDAFNVNNARRQVMGGGMDYRFNQDAFNNYANQAATATNTKIQGYANAQNNFANAETSRIGNMSSIEQKHGEDEAAAWEKFGENMTKVGNNMAGADKQSYLDNGKGLFEYAFSKKS